MSSSTDFFGGVPPKWVSGTTYAVDRVVRSPISQHDYIRIVAGAGTTDPSADTTNWALYGPGGIKSIQRGVISLTGTSATATISAVNPLKSLEAYLGSDSNGGAGQPLTADDAVKVVLTNSTTITASRVTNAGSIPNVSWRVVEYW